MYINSVYVIKQLHSKKCSILIHSSSPSRLSVCHKCVLDFKFCLNALKRWNIYWTWIPFLVDSTKRKNCWQRLILSIDLLALQQYLVSHRCSPRTDQYGRQCISQVRHDYHILWNAYAWRHPLRLVFINWKHFFTVYWKETELVGRWGNCLRFLYENIFKGVKMWCTGNISHLWRKYIKGAIYTLFLWED